MKLATRQVTGNGSLIDQCSAFHDAAINRHRLTHPDHDNLTDLHRSGV
jgi:hypothetical protein